MANQEEINQWQKLLEENFSHNGIIGGQNLMKITELEKTQGEIFLAKYQGFKILTDSFLDFYAQTLIIQAKFNSTNGWPPDPYYTTSLVMFATVFRAMRSAEILSTSGYPMQGYAALRSVKDQIWVLCAAANKISTIEELFGFSKDNYKDEDMKSIVENRRRVEQKIRKLIIGNDSNLSEDTQKWLLKWDQMFNWEAHRSLHTLFDISSRLNDPQVGPISLLSGNSETLDAMYLNRSLETNWMLLRLLPFSRRKETMSEEWSKKWKILDNSFEIFINSISEMGKPIGNAFIELIRNKFIFDGTNFFSHS